MTSDYIRYNTIEYVMPFLFCNDIFIPLLDKLLEEEHNPIRYVYGTVRCAWAGGRPSSINILSLNGINNYLKIIKKYNVIPVFTFNSSSQDKDILNNEFCNNLLDIAYSNNSQFIVATDMLYNHIKARYKDAKMVCSVINPHLKYIESMLFNETQFYKRMLDKYEIVVVRPEWSIENADKIDKLIPDIERIEVLINQRCHFNCKSAKLHYNLHEQIEAGTLDQNEYNKKIIQICPKYKSEYKSVYMEDEIVEKLVDKGVKLFKLQGRDLPFETLFDDLYNFIFNKKYSKDELLNKANNICAKLIQENKIAQLNLI